MNPPVTARSALVQSLYWDREKPIWATTCLATLIGRQVRQHDIAVHRLHRCIGQIATLERWREGQNEAATATTAMDGYLGQG